MSKFTIIANRADAVNVEKEERYRWVRALLTQMGLKLSEAIYPEEPTDFSLEQKVKLREQLQKNNLTILDTKFSGCQIFLKEDPVAVWKKPNYIYKIDHNEIDPKKKLYVEILIDFWSIFEEDDD